MDWGQGKNPTRSLIWPVSLIEAAQTLGVCNTEHPFMCLLIIHMSFFAKKNLRPLYIFKWIICHFIVEL